LPVPVPTASDPLLSLLFIISNASTSIVTRTLKPQVSTKFWPRFNTHFSSPPPNLVLYFWHLFLKCDAAFHWPTAFFHILPLLGKMGNNERRGKMKKKKKKKKKKMRKAG
jgi:hypothetical protein